MNYESQSTDRKFPNWRRRMAVGAAAIVIIGGGAAMDIFDGNKLPDKTIFAAFLSAAIGGSIKALTSGPARGEAPDAYGNKRPEDDLDNE